MMYFWVVPILLVLLVLLWMFYSSATKRAPGKTSGRTVTEKSDEGGSNVATGR